MLKLFELIVGAEHQDVDAGDHARDGLIRDLRKGLLAELEEDDVSTVAEHQEFEVVMPHLRISLNEPMKAGNNFVVLREASRLVNDRNVFEFRQLRHFDGVRLFDEARHLADPLIVEFGPVRVVVTGALAKHGCALLYFLGIGHGVGRDVNATVVNAIIDAERGGKREDARHDGAHCRVRKFRAERIESRNRLGKMHRVVEPEALIVFGPEARVIGVHVLPALGARH